MIAIAQPGEIERLEEDRDYFIKRITWAERYCPDDNREYAQRLRRTVTLIQRAIDELQPR